MFSARGLVIACAALSLLLGLQTDVVAKGSALRGVVVGAPGGNLSNELFVARFSHPVALKTGDVFYVLHRGQYVGTARVCHQGAWGTSEALLIKDFPEEAVPGDRIVFRRQATGLRSPITVDVQVGLQVRGDRGDADKAPKVGNTGPAAFLVSEGSSKVTIVVNGEKTELDRPRSFTEQVLLSGPLCYTTPLAEDSGKKLYMPRYVSMADQTIPYTTVLTCARVREDRLFAFDELDRPVVVHLRPDTLIFAANGTLAGPSLLNVTGTRVRALLGGPSRTPEAVAVVADAPMGGLEMTAVQVQVNRGQRIPQLTVPSGPCKQGVLLRQVVGAEVQSIDEYNNTLVIREPMGGKRTLDIPLDTILTVRSATHLDAWYWQTAASLTSAVDDVTVLGSRSRMSLHTGEVFNAVLADTPRGTTLVAIGSVPFRYDEPRGYKAHVLRPCRTTPYYYEIDLPSTTAAVERDVFRVYRNQRSVGEAMLVNRRPVATIVARRCEGPLQTGDVLVLERRRPMARAYLKLLGEESTPGSAR